MVRKNGSFDPEDLTLLKLVCEQIWSERRFRVGGLEAERVAARAITLFDCGYTNEANLIRALRQDA